MALEKNVRTLRDMIALDESCARRFDEAERLARSLFTLEDCVPLPGFTQDGTDYCAAVERTLNQLIWGTQKEARIAGEDAILRQIIYGIEKEPPIVIEDAFVPTPEEVMYLLSAAWLHDIGLIYGIFRGEKPGDLIEDTPKVMSLRNEHELRTVRYILEVWKLECGWSRDQKTWLSNVCIYHRRNRPIDTFDPVQIISKHDRRPVRLKVAATLLRTAVELTSNHDQHIEGRKERDLDERLLLRFYVPEFVSKEDVVDPILKLYRALNRYHIACGGSGFTIDDWQTFVPKGAHMEVS